ncbi:MAG TPA: hypothetical protein VFG72_03445 [Marmoricola sp.]|nr:hypothetical protein [Marmoricola sp.]
MTVTTHEPARGRLDSTSAGRPHGWLKPGWPLVLLYAGFPLWWALGLSQAMFFFMAAAMAVTLWRRGLSVVPRGFGLWLLFLLWIVAGVFVLWAHAAGTVEGGGISRLVGYVVRAGWYAAVTVVMLYVLNTAKELPTLRVVRLLGWMFIVTVGFGLVAVVAPELQFPSLAELVLPSSVTRNGFIYTLVHPSLASSSEFLGYVQPRPTAPFPFSNAWGNNVAMYLPFFIYGWFGPGAGWRRAVAPLILLAAAVPITFSLNRGMWLALLLAAVYAAVRLALHGRLRALQVLVVSAVVGGALFVSSPLYDTVVLRIETPHSNERRANVAEEVVSVTMGSPIVGYGTTRTKIGSYSSIAGGGTPECKQCAPPPLGTQGFMWRLILTTGFVGTVLFLSFFAVQFLRRARGPSPLDVMTCSSLVVALTCFFVYDSLGSALFTAMIAVGLMARPREGQEVAG